MWKERGCWATTESSFGFRFRGGLQKGHSFKADLTGDWAVLSGKGVIIIGHRVFHVALTPAEDVS